MGSPTLSARYVFDTNVVVSALVFQGGSLCWLRHAWASGRVTPVVSRAKATEPATVLAYPRFALDDGDRTELLADYLPFAELITDPVPRAAARAADPHDQPFVDLCVASGATGLVTADARLLELAPTVAVITPAALREHVR